MEDPLALFALVVPRPFFLVNSSIASNIAVPAVTLHKETYKFKKPRNSHIFETTLLDIQILDGVPWGILQALPKGAIESAGRIESGKYTCLLKQTRLL